MMAQETGKSQMDAAWIVGAEEELDNCVCVKVDIHNGLLDCGELRNVCKPEVIVVVKTTANIESGDAVVARLNGELVMKQYVKTESVVMLTEPNTEPVFVENDDRFMIIGKPIQFNFNFK